MIVVDGVEWTSRSVNEEIIEEGTAVIVVSIQGVKAIVKKAE